MKKKVLVLGEACNDEFIYGKCDRLNPEAPSPILTPVELVKNYGMAANTFKNLQHLGLDPTHETINNSNSGFPIITKRRFVDKTSNYILLRVDEGENLVVPLVNGGEEAKFIEDLNLSQYSAVVISDYNKGELTEKLMKMIFSACDDLDIPTFLDTKKKLGGWAGLCTFIKINEPELNASHHHPDVLYKFMRQSLIVTRGSKGATYLDETYPTKSSEVMDVVGAGDTFLAGLVYGYLEFGDIKQAIRLANKLATNVVSKSGVALPDLKILEW